MVVSQTNRSLQRLNQGLVDLAFVITLVPRRSSAESDLSSEEDLLSAHDSTTSAPHRRHAKLCLGIDKIKRRIRKVDCNIREPFNFSLPGIAMEYIGFKPVPVHMSAGPIINPNNPNPTNPYPNHKETPVKIKDTYHGNRGPIIQLERRHRDIQVSHTGRLSPCKPVAVKKTRRPGGNSNGTKSWNRTGDHGRLEDSLCNACQ